MDLDKYIIVNAAFMTMYEIEAFVTCNKTFEKCAMRIRICEIFLRINFITLDHTYASKLINLMAEYVGTGLFRNSFDSLVRSGPVGQGQN